VSEHRAHTPDEILRASAAWVWFPRGSEQEKTDLQLVRHPARFGGGVKASQVDSTRSAAEVLEYAIQRTRAWGETELTFWTNESDSPDLEEELRGRGARHIDTVAVLARPIEGAPIDVPGDVTAEVVRTEEQFRELDRINVAVWEHQSALTDDGLREELDEIAASLAAGTGGRVISRLDGVAVSTGGCTVADGFVRLWGAATLPEARGRGAYRAVLAARLRLGAEMGATTALVKGRISTSAPILARAGFEHFGDERGYVLTV
jgi:GNAT superfamily N-acetyltransferase